LKLCTRRHGPLGLSSGKTRVIDSIEYIQIEIVQADQRGFRRHVDKVAFFRVFVTTLLLWIRVFKERGQLSEAGIQPSQLIGRSSPAVDTASRLSMSDI
jgi:hypothetical protein